MATKRASEKKLVMSPGAGKSPSAHKTAPSQRSPRPPASVGVVTVADAPHEAIATQAVAALAYSYWLARGCEGGSPEEDWLRAERELRVSGCVSAATA